VALVADDVTWLLPAEEGLMSSEVEAYAPMTISMVVTKTRTPRLGVAFTMLTSQPV